MEHEHGGRARVGARARGYEQDNPEAPTGRDILAQGEALGDGRTNEYALKGQDIRISAL